jgi:hypothetical protein
MLVAGCYSCSLCCASGWSSACLLQGSSPNLLRLLPSLLPPPPAALPPSPPPPEPPPPFAAPAALHVASNCAATAAAAASLRSRGWQAAAAAGCVPRHAGAHFSCNESVSKASEAPTGECAVGVGAAGEVEVTVAFGVAAAAQRKACGQGQQNS